MENRATGRSSRRGGRRKVLFKQSQRPTVNAVNEVQEKEEDEDEEEDEERKFIHS